MPKNASKFAYDISIFKAEPPEDPRLIKKLFCGREAELHRGVEILKNGMDVKGARSKKALDKRPWVIHGESRSGKSHLARRIMLDLPKSKKRHQVLIAARERLQAVRIMWELLNEAADIFANSVVEIDLSDSLLRGQVELVRQILERLDQFRIGADGLTLSLDETQRQSVEGGLKLGVPRVFQIAVKSGWNTQRKDGASLNLRAPDARMLSEYVAMIVDILRRLDKLDHLLVVVDDVDLIESYEDADHNGRIERSVLADALVQLHQTPGVDVVLTARSWYAHSKKEFTTLIDLALCDQLPAEALILIHDKHFSVFGRKLQHGFLVEEALRQAATMSQGQPGVFLRNLKTAFERYQAEDDWQARDFDWYLDVFRGVFHTFRQKYPEAVQALLNAVQRGAQTVDVGKENSFFGTVFDEEFVSQSYYRERTYNISPLVFKVLQPELTSSILGLDNL